MCTEFVKKRHPWLNGLWNALPQLHWIMQWPHSCQYTLSKWWWNLAPVVSNTKATGSLNYGLKDSLHGEKQATKNAKHVSWVGEIFSTLASTITIYYWDVSCRLSRKEPKEHVFVTTLKEQPCFLFRPWNWAKRSVKSHISTELDVAGDRWSALDCFGSSCLESHREKLLGAWSAGGPSSPEVVVMKSIHIFRGVIVS